MRMRIKVGRENIKAGSLLSQSRLGNLKPAKPGEDIMGTAWTDLPAGKMADMDQKGKAVYPGYVDRELTNISVGYAVRAMERGSKR